MPDTRLSIRLDLPSGDRIGPGKIALLESIQATGSISAAARKLGMSYRRAWLLVEQINKSLQRPAVTAATGGRQGGGAVLTPSGERVVELYRSIEDVARSSAKEEFRAVGNLVRKRRARAPEALHRRGTIGAVRETAREISGAVSADVSAPATLCSSSRPTMSVHDTANDQSDSTPHRRSS